MHYLYSPLPHFAGTSDRDILPFSIHRSRTIIGSYPSWACDLADKRLFLRTRGSNQHD